MAANLFIPPKRLVVFLVLSFGALRQIRTTSWMQKNDTDGLKPIAVTWHRHHRPIAMLTTDQSPSYLFFMPLLPKVWDRIMNHSVMIFTIGNETEWNSSPLLQYSLEQIQMAVRASPGSVHMFVNVTANQTRSMAQNLRLFAPAWKHVHPSVRMVTSDVDLVPINPRRLDVDNGTDLVITNAFCCGNQTVKNLTSRHYPMCHISASAGLWRRFMNYSALVEGTVELENLATSTLESFFGKGCTNNIVRAGPGWFMDQQYVSYRIAKCLPDDQMTKRHLSRRERIEGFRLSNVRSDQLKAANDAHLPRYAGENSWVRIRNLLKHFYDDKEMLQLDEYEAEFRRLICQNNVGSTEYRQNVCQQSSL